MPWGIQEPGEGAQLRESVMEFTGGAEGPVCLGRQALSAASAFKLGLDLIGRGRFGHT
jgi:hypothetical protein